MKKRAWISYMLPVICLLCVGILLFSPVMSYAWLVVIGTSGERLLNIEVLTEAPQSEEDDSELSDDLDDDAAPAYEGDESEPVDEGDESEPVDEGDESEPVDEGDESKPVDEGGESKPVDEGGESKLDADEEEASFDETGQDMIDNDVSGRDDSRQNESEDEASLLQEVPQNPSPQFDSDPDIAETSEAG